MKNRKNKSVILLYISLVFFILSTQEIFCQNTIEIYHERNEYGIIRSSAEKIDLTKALLLFEYDPQTISLYVGHYSTYSESNRGYIEFDLSSIPADATITSASLHLYCDSPIVTNTNTGGTIYLKSLDYRPTTFINSVDWAFLNGTSTFKTVTIDWTEEEVISGTDLVTKIESSTDGYLYFGLINSAELSNGISLSRDDADLYLSVTYTPGDTEPQTVPSNLHVTGATYNSVSLAWNASTDNVGVKDYQVYKGSTLVKTVTGTSCTITGLQECTSYTFKVRARDAAGNVSAYSTEISGSTTSSAPTTVTYNTDKTSTIEFYPEAQQTIYLQPGFKYEAIASNYIMRTQLGGCSGSKAYSIVNIIDDKIDNTINNGETEPVIDKKDDLNSKECLFETNISLYPNPTPGVLNVDCKNNKEYTITVLSINGSVVIKELNKLGHSKIDITDQPDGIYFILVQTEDGEIIHQKIIKM